MLNCLIDTCSLINLLSKEDSLTDIEILNFWQEQNAIQILLPETVRMEWDEHKIKEKEKHRQSLKTKFKHTREVLNKTSLNIPSGYLEMAYGKIETKINAIDDLLDKSDEILITDRVKALVPDRSLKQKNQKRKAPFHNKIDSVKDAYIIISTLEYLKRNKLNCLLFISENKNDFGNPTNKSREIHPDISNDYPLIEIDYYSDVFHAINDYKKSLPIKKNEKPVEVTSNQFSDKGKIYIDKSVPILNQVYYYLKIRFKEIKVLPSYFFLTGYPFENGSKCYRNDFNIRNVNPDLFELLKSFDIKNGELINNFRSENDFDKASYILKTLYRNHIFYLNGRKREDFRDIRVYNEEQENKSLEKYFQFKFIEVFKKTDYKKTSNKLYENLEDGYFYYKIGNLIEAKNCFIKSKELAQNENNELSQLICNHNLYHLARSIELRYWRLENKDEIVSELKNINNRLTKVSPHNSKIKDLIIDASFFINAQIKLQTLKEEIVDTYHHYLRGGRSTNNFNWEIYYQYATLHQFLTKNHVVYEHYSDYGDVINNLIESVFASYSIKRGTNKVNNLNDYTLFHFIHYAKTKDLEKLYKRYKVSMFNYVRSNNEDGIVPLFLNFISNDINDLKEVLKAHPEQVSDKFWSDYNRYFSNLMFLCSILKFDKKVVNSLSKSILKFIDKNSSSLFHVTNDNSKYVYHFFIRQQKFISPLTIKKLLFTSYKYEDLFSEYLSIELIDACIKLNQKINITDIQLSKIIIPFIRRRVFEGSKLGRYNIVSHIYPLLSPNQRKLFSEFYREILDNEYNYYLFYMLVVYDILDINEGNYLNMYLNNIDLKNEVEDNRRWIFEKPTFSRYNKIDYLLNMWFKYDFDIKDSRIEKIRNINNYYNWLIDLDGFDYSNFEIEWLNEFGTKYYYKHFRKSKILKGKLKNILEEDFDVKYKKVFCDIYSYNSL